MRYSCQDRFLTADRNLCIDISVKPPIFLGEGVITMGAAYQLGKGTCISCPNMAVNIFPAFSSTTACLQDPAPGRYLPAFCQPLKSL
jgi:hypothetical protein